MEGFLVANESQPLIQQAIDASRRYNPFGPKFGEQANLTRDSNLRGYLAQPVSNGEKALCLIVKHNPAYICFKIDLAGIIYLNHPDGDSTFQLKFSGTDLSFTTDIISVSNLTCGKLLHSIADASSGRFTIQDMTGGLGHPFQSNGLILNSDLYPAKPRNYQELDTLDSLIGSWIFGIASDKVPANLDVDLLFSVDGESSVQLNGPAVMTIHKITSCPTSRYEVVCDIMQVASPTPLRGGTLVALIPFDDIGCYGIISANPREYLFQIDYLA